MEQCCCPEKTCRQVCARPATDPGDSLRAEFSKALQSRVQAESQAPPAPSQRRTNSLFFLPLIPKPGSHWPAVNSTTEKSGCSTSSVPCPPGEQKVPILSRAAFCTPPPPRGCCPSSYPNQPHLTYASRGHPETGLSSQSNYIVC